MADKFGPHVERLRAVAASPSRRLLAIGGERDVRNLARSAAEAGKMPTSLHVFALPKPKPEFSQPVGSAVYALCFASDELLMAGLGDGSILGWDPTSVSDGKGPRQILELGEAHRGPVRALAADAPGAHVASVGDDGVLRVGKLSAGKGKLRFELSAARTLSQRALRAVAIDPQLTLVACAGDDGVIRSLPLDDVAGAVPREMPCGEGGIFALCFTGDGRIAAGCSDGSVHLCYLEGAVDAENRSGDAAHTAPVRGLVYGLQLYDDAKRPLSRRMFSIAEDGELKAWPLDSRRRPRTIKVSSAALHAMILIPPGRGVKADRRGGTLAIVDQDRGLSLIEVNEESEPSESIERLESRLVELEQSLRASSVQVRQDTVRALAELSEDEARALLDRALTSDYKPEVRKAAAEAIGKSGRRLSRPALRTALSDSDKTVRRAALDALTTIEADAPLGSVRAALQSAHADVRVIAVKRLPELRDVSPLVPGLIAERLKDSAVEVRVAALDALYALEGKASIEPVRTALLRGPADIRVLALLRLGRARQTENPQGRALLESGFDDDDASVRQTAFLISIGARARLSARVRTADSSTRKALGELEKEGSFADAVEDASTIALTDDDLEPLFAALTCRHADIAMRAARTLGLLGDSRATGALLQLSRETSAETRRLAAEALQDAALAMPGDDRLVARLQWLLDDSDASVRTAAFEALAMLSLNDEPAGSLDLAAQVLRCSQEDIRLRALPVLVQFGGQGKHAREAELFGRADALLGNALDDESARVRNEAFNTLWAWYSKDPRTPLTRGAACRHADIRKRVVDELAHLKDRKTGDWGDTLLLSLVVDSSADVGLAAYQALTDTKVSKAADRGRVEVHRAALFSPRPEVRAAGCKGAPKAAGAELRDRLVELVRDEHPPVHLAAIEAIDRLIPSDAEGFAAAFASVFYELRVRAAELCGKRRDTRAVAPAKEILTIPETSINRPADVFRQRAARALADVGDHDSIPFYVSLLDDKDGIVREMGGRGLATACHPGDEKPLVDALSHADLAVRSWVAEGLARLGDDRAVPVLAGTLRHDHQPLRLGAIMGFVALGPDGVRGILQGLDDANREIQDLVFAVIVARDVALARAGQAPDLLLSAMASSHPEIRFAAARILEARIEGEDLGPLAQELVGPRKPDKASDMKDWPGEDERKTRLEVLVSALASDHPAQRYAATQVLSLRGQPLAFWREAARLIGPAAANRPRIPYTNWEDGEQFQPRKKGWIRSLFTRRAAAREQSATERVLTVIKFAGAAKGRALPPTSVEFTAAHARKLAFGTYAGLVRQAPVRGESDETHRVRRDSIDRLAALGASRDVGADAVLPVLRRALSDPHHLVRKAAVTALGGLYKEGSLEPHALALESSAADVGKSAVDALVAAALKGSKPAARLAQGAVDAPVPEVRAYAMTQIQRLFDADSLEPWLIALGSRHADVRLSVVDRLVDSTDTRVSDALGRALESDHEDLRLKAAVALARRGDVRTVDVLAGFLRSEEARLARAATEALVSLAHARPQDASAADIAAAAARTVAARIEDDPDRTADRNALISALGRIGSPAAGDVLTGLMSNDDAAIRMLAFTTLMEIAKDRKRGARTLQDGTRREAYHEPLALSYVREAAASTDVQLRLRATQILRDIDDRGAEDILARLVDDREAEVRVAAAEALAFRAEYVAGASIETLASTLRAGRRELVLPAAAGLASKRRPEAFQALLLVFKAGAQEERERAVLALGQLGDRRALEELERLIDTKAELEDDDKALAPAAAEALGRMLPHLADTGEHGAERTRVRDLVEHLAKEGEEDMRARTITGLRHAGDARSRTFIERIAQDTFDDEDIRVHATRELGLLGDPASEPVLAELLNEDDYTFRHAALTSLERIFPRERTRTSLLALRSPHEDISAAAAAFLARRGDPVVLVGRLSEIESDEVRQRLRRGLIRRRACPVDQLRVLLEGDALGPRQDAAWIAGACSEKSLAGAVKKAVVRSQDQWVDARQRISSASDGAGQRRLAQAEEAWRASLWAADRLSADVGDAARKTIGMREAPAPVRCEALRFVAHHGSAKDLALMQPCLTDPDASVRARAAAAIAALAPERTRSVIEQTPVADAASMGPVVEAALAESPDAVKKLLGNDASRQVVLPVVLGKKRDQDLMGLATGKGEDASRLVAIASLGRIGGSEAEKALQSILDNKKEKDAVRAAAFKAMRRLQRRAAKQARYEEASAP